MPTIEDLLKAVADEQRVWCLAIPSIKREASFTAPWLAEVISDCCETDGKWVPSHDSLSLILDGFVRRGLLILTRPKSNGRFPLKVYSYAEGSEDYQLGAKVALEFVGVYHQGLYAVINRFRHVGRDFKDRMGEWVGLLRLLKKARSEIKGIPMRRKYLTSSMVYDMIDLPHATIEKRLPVLEDAGYIVLRTEPGEMAVFSSGALDFLRSSRSGIDDKILTFLNLNGFPAKGKISDYLFNRLDIYSLVGRAFPRKSVEKRLGYLRQEGLYGGVHSAGHTEILTTQKYWNFMKRLYGRLALISNGNSALLGEEMEGAFASQRYFRQAVMDSVGLYAGSRGNKKWKNFDGK